MKQGIFLTALTICAVVFAADITDSFDPFTWNHWSPVGCKMQYKGNATNGINGTACAEIAILPGNPANKEGCLMKRFPLTAGKQYQASIMVKNNGAGENAKASLSIQDFTTAGAFRSVVTSAKRRIAGDWQRLTCNFTVSDKAPVIQVLLSAGGATEGSFLYDDFTLKELNAADGIVDHFDSASGWGFWKAPEAKTAKIFVEDDGKEAKGCIGVEILAGNPKKCSGSLLRRFPVEKGKEYTFIVQAKSIGLTNDTKISLSLQGQDAKTLFLGTGVQGTNIKAESCRDWTRMVFTYKIPSTGKWANCAYVLVTMGTSGDATGKALFDDFEYFVNEEE